MKITTYNNINILIRLVIFISLWTGPAAEAQEREEMLTEEEVVDRVKQHNWDIIKMRSSEGIAKSNLTSSNATFLPSVYFTESFTTTTDPMLAFGTKLGQSAITQEDFAPDQLNNPDRISNFSTRLNIEQPLFNLDGYHSRLALKKNLDASHMDRAWTERIIVVEARNLYYQLVIALEAKEVTKKMMQASDSSLQIAKDLFEEGMIDKTELMDAELHHLKMQSDLLDSQHMISRVNDALLQHMGETKSYRIIPEANDLLTDAPEKYWSETEISDQRADLQSSKLRTEASNLALTASKGLFVPRINAFGSYGFNDPRLFGTQSDNYMIGVQLRWDLFGGGKQLGAIQKAQFEKQFATNQLEEKRMAAARQFDQLKNDYELARIKVQMAEKRVSQSLAKSQIIKDRYAEGLEKTADLIDDQARLLASQLVVLNSRYRMLQIQLQLEAATSSELLNN